MQSRRGFVGGEEEEKNEICGSFARSKLLWVPIKEMKIWHWHLCRESQSFVAFTAVLLSGGQLLPDICLRGVFFPDICIGWVLFPNICITELVVEQYLSIFVSQENKWPNIYRMCCCNDLVLIVCQLFWLMVLPQNDGGSFVTDMWRCERKNQTSSTFFLEWKYCLFWGFLPRWLSSSTCQIASTMRNPPSPFSLVRFTNPLSFSSLPLPLLW